MMMKNIIIYIVLLLSIYVFLGCSRLSKEDILKAEIKEELLKDDNISDSLRYNKPPVEIIKVGRDNFNLETVTVPDMEIISRIRILGAPLNDVIALLTEATGQDVIFQLQANNVANAGITTGTGIGGVGGVGATGAGVVTGEVGGLSEIRNSEVFVSATDIGFGRLLKKTVGDKLSIRYEDETYYLGSIKTVTLKIPSVTGLATIITGTLSSLGAINTSIDKITSSITFSAREKEYQDIMQYLTILRNNLYVIEYEIAIYDVELSDDYSLGIDWNLLSEASKGISLSASASASSGVNTVPATFGTILDMDMLSGIISGKALTKFGKVESIQKPKLLGIAGTDVKLTDGQEESYISSLSTTAFGDNGLQTSTESATATSGVNITLNSNVMDGTIITNISLAINDIVGYSSFSVDGVSYNQPKTRTKNIQNTMRVQPGVPIVIAGLFRHNSNKEYKGIPGLEDTSAKLIGGGESDNSKKSEMIIIVTPRLIKYVME